VERARWTRGSNEACWSRERYQLSFSASTAWIGHDFGLIPFFERRPLDEDCITSVDDLLG